MRLIKRGWSVMSGLLLAIGFIVQPVMMKAGTIVTHYQELFEWQTDMQGISALAWSPDGQWLAAIGGDGMLQIWGAGDGHVLNTMKVYSGPLDSLDWSPDGYTLATGGDDGTIRIWDPKEGRELCIFTGHGRTLSPGGGNPNGVAVVKWSPDGKIIASGGQDGRLMLWPVDSKECRLVQPLVISTIHPYGIAVVDWNAASDKVLSMGLYNRLPIWDAKTGEKRDDMECPMPYSGESPCIFFTADWGPDGKHIVASGGTGYASFSRIWDVATKTSRDLSDMCTIGFSWMPKGSALVGWCDGQLQMFDVDTLQMIGTTEFAAGYWEKGQDHIFNAYAISPDEQRIAISYQAGAEMDAIIQILGVSPNGSG